MTTHNVMNRTTFHISVLFISLFFLAACKPREEKIIIISTNDIHSAIDNFPKLATLVGEYRDQYPGHVVLIDAGDRWTGNPYVDLAPKMGYPIVALMNELGYDLGTYGNHEFDNGYDTLAARVAEMDFDIICANIDTKDTSLPQPAPYKIVSVGNRKLGFVGFVTTASYGYPDGKRASFGPITFTDAVEIAPEFEYLKDSCDVLIGLTHIGADFDSLLVNSAPIFDLIIGGHSHTVIPERNEYMGTVITQTGSRLRNVGVTTLTFIRGKLSGIDTELVPLEGYPVDMRYEGMVAGFKINKELSKVVGEMAEGVDKVGLMNLVTDVCRQATGAEYVIYNWGGIRFDTLPPGPVTRFDIHSLEPFQTEMVIEYLSLGDIQSMILNKFNSAGGESHGIDLAVSGLRYQVVTGPDPDNRDGHDVIFLDYAGETLRENAVRHKTAVASYVNDVYDYTRSGKTYYTGQIVSGLLTDYFLNHSPVTADPVPRARVVQ